MRKKKNQMSNKVFALLGIELLLIGFILGMVFFKIKYTNETYPQLPVYDEFQVGCYNMSLVETAECLTDSIIPIFKYHVTSDDVLLSFHELISEGGDCRDWSLLYVSLAQERGFNSGTVGIETKKNTAHVFAVMSDETGYCLLDQTVYSCYGFDN